MRWEGKRQIWRASSQGSRGPISPVYLTHISSQTWEVLMCTGYCMLVKAESHEAMDNVSSFRWKILGVNVNASRYWLSLKNKKY